MNGIPCSRIFGCEVLPNLHRDLSGDFIMEVVVRFFNEDDEVPRTNCPAMSHAR